MDTEGDWVMIEVIHKVVIPPEVLKRGFWLYVWLITLRDDRNVYYVGRTGDASSARAQSPFSRISGHLGSNEHSNALQRNLKKRGIHFDQCIKLDFVAHGPLHGEVADWDAHKPIRDKVHSLERDLCKGMKAAGYDVLNDVSCKFPTDDNAWRGVRDKFARHFERLAPSP
jgi:hypothetical protein